MGSVLFTLTRGRGAVSEMEELHPDKRGEAATANRVSTRAFTVADQ